jgi:hypothetical protein
MSAARITSLHHAVAVGEMLAGRWSRAVDELARRRDRLRWQASGAGSGRLGGDPVVVES